MIPAESIGATRSLHGQHTIARTLPSFALLYLLPKDHDKGRNTRHSVITGKK